MLRVKTEYLPAAIEISSNSLKLLQLGRIKSSLKIVKAGYASLQHDKGDPELSLKRSLESFVKSNEIKGEVATSLPLNKINAFNYILPNMPPDEIESALLWKVRQNLTGGINFDDITFDYCFSNTAGDNKEIYALVFTAAKKITSDMIKLFKEFSLDLIIIEPKPYAIIEALSLLKKISEEETVLVLQLGGSESSITVISSGHPFLMTPLNVSGNGFTEALANYYQLDWAKAEALKIKEGLGALQLKETQNEEGQMHCFPVLSSQLENLIIDIEHTFKYFSHQLIKSKVAAFDRLILCGGQAGLKNLDKFLTDKLGVPVVVFDPLDFFISHSEHEVSPEIKTHSTEFASALGLATRFIENERPAG